MTRADKISVAVLLMVVLALSIVASWYLNQTRTDHRPVNPLPRVEIEDQTWRA